MYVKTLNVGVVALSLFLGSSALPIDPLINQLSELEKSEESQETNFTLDESQIAGEELESPVEPPLPELEINEPNDLETKNIQPPVSDKVSKNEQVPLPEVLANVDKNTSAAATVKPDLKFEIKWTTVSQSLNEVKLGVTVKATSSKSSVKGKQETVWARVAKVVDGKKTLGSLYSGKLNIGGPAIPITIIDRNYDPSKVVKYTAEVFTGKLDKSYTLGNIATTPVKTIQTKKSVASFTKSNFDGKTKAVAKSKTHKFTTSISNPIQISRSIYVQKYDIKTKKWINVKTFKTGVAKSYQLNYTVSRSTESSQQFRLYAPATANYPAYTSKSTKLTREKGTFSVKSYPTQVSKIAPWTTTKMAFYVNTNGSKKWVTLQRKIGNEQWKNIDNVLSNTTAGTYEFNTSKGRTTSRTINIQYRVYIYADNYTNAATTKPLTVSWDNPYNYTGMKAEMWNYTKQWCPTQLITLESGLVNGYAWALATPALNETRVYAGTPGQHRRTLANHECGHHLQSKAVYNSKVSYGALSDYLGRIHGTSPEIGLERNADCIANIMAANSYWGYGNYGCSGARHTIASQILNGQKLKFQKI